MIIIFSMFKIKHYIIVRFYCYDFNVLPEGTIFDEKFLNNAIDIFKKTCIRSLENQTCKDFELLVLINDNISKNHPSIIKLNDLCKTTSFVSKVLKLNELNIQNDNTYDYIITSRIDYDDFAKFDAVEEIQSTTSDLPYVVFGYLNGIAIKDVNDINTCLEYLPTYGNNGPMSVMATLIVNTKTCKQFLTIIDLINHAILHKTLKKVYEENDIEYDDNAYVLVKDRLSYLYVNTGCNVSCASNPDKKWGVDDNKVVRTKEWYKIKFGLE